MPVASGTAAQKADLFGQLAGQVGQVNKLSGGSWSTVRAVRGLGTEGSHVFLGEAGEALIISPQGQLFRGSLQSGVRVAGSGTFEIDYSLLKALQ